MAAAAEAIYIGIDNSDWMVGEGSDNFDAQCDAIEFYCKTKFDANPDSVVGLFLMSSGNQRLLLFPPSSDLGEIVDEVQDIDPGYGHLDVATVAYSVPFLRLCRPGLKKRILLFAGGPTNLHPTAVDLLAEKFKDSSIALDVVNFYLEKRCKYMANGYHFGRSALDALVAATDVDDNSHIVHVEPKSSIKDVLSKSILKNTLKKTLLASLGEKTFVGIPGKPSGTIKEQLEAIAPALKQLWTQKEERIKEFLDVQIQIQKMCGEISGGNQQAGTPKVDESDLSLKKLDEFHDQLQELQKEKSDRLHKVLEFVSTVHDLCGILGIDFYSTVTEVHPSLNDATGVQSKSISNDTLARLAKTVSTLKEDKKQRLKKLQEFATQLIDLWNLMDTSEKERSLFDHVTCNISASVDEVTIPGALAVDLIEQAEVEVERLDKLKASRMKEIAFKRQGELEEIFAHAHIEIDTQAAREKILSLIDSGNVEPSELLADMDNQIIKAKEEAISRKDILDKVEKWMSACEEESWLDDYNRDHNRYNASRGAHLNLKRAEKARILVNKIPALVDSLVTKTRAWEEEHELTFAYDGVPLLAMLDEYALLRHDREEERRRMKDQKKFHEQLNTEQEAIFGSRPSPARPLSSTKKVVGPRVNGGAANGTPNRRLSLNQNGSKSGKRDSNARPIAPSNYVAITKEDAASHVSGTEPAPNTS